MGGKRASKSELFLMELIFSILFFSIASAVCVTLFVHARLTSIESTQLTAATLQAQSAAETFKSVNADLDQVADLLNAQQTSEGSLQILYDQNWNPVSEPDSASYLLTLTPDDPSPDSDQLCSAQIQVSKQGESIYELTVTQYVR